MHAGVTVELNDASVARAVSRCIEQLTTRAAHATFVATGDQWDEADAAQTADAVAEDYERARACVAGRTVVVFVRMTNVDVKPVRLRTLGEQLLGTIPIRRDTWLAAAKPRKSPDELPAAVAEATEAINAARALGYPPGVVLFEDIAVPYALVLDNRIREHLTAIVEPVLHEGDRSNALADTLSAFFAEGLELSRTAARLGIHRHTVRYRLRQAERLLGRSVRDLPDRLLIELGLVAARGRKG